MDKKILVSMMVIGLVATLAGAGLYAYFSDTETSSGNTFTAGTFDLKLSNDGSTWEDGVTATWESPDNWAPGESVEAKLWMTNFGSIGVNHIRVKGEDLVDNGLADAVLITKLVYTETALGEVDITSWFIGLIDADDNGKATLTEFITWCETPHSLIFFEGNWPPTQPYLQPGGANTQYLIFKFTFDSDAENEYQGESASFDLVIFAYQSPEQYPPEWWAPGGSHGY